MKYVGATNNFIRWPFIVEGIIIGLLAVLISILVIGLAYNFISTWQYSDKSFYYYDWMVRDFFEYMSKQPNSQVKWKVMGSGRYIYCYGSFQAKAKKAYAKAIDAIEHSEYYSATANKEWREIFGNKFPYI